MRGGRAALVKLAILLIVEEALEAESRDNLGRDYYEHGVFPGQGWRIGVRMGRVKTAEGLVDYAAPQIAGREEPFRSETRESLKGRIRALEDLAVERPARGLRACATPRTRSATRAGGYAGAHPPDRGQGASEAATPVPRACAAHLPRPVGARLGDCGPHPARRTRLRRPARLPRNGQASHAGRLATAA